jgi:hypothetical protein
MTYRDNYCFLLFNICLKALLHDIYVPCMPGDNMGSRKCTTIWQHGGYLGPSKFERYCDEWVAHIKSGAKVK